MACINDTNSIDLTIAAGVLTADAKVSVPALSAPPNPIAVASDGLWLRGVEGWLNFGATLAYSSTIGGGGAACYVVNTSADIRSFIGTGTKMQLLHGGTPKDFIVVAVSASTLTLWGSDFYSLSPGAITIPSFSNHESPPGWVGDYLSRCSAPPAVAYEGMKIKYLADGLGAEWEAEYNAGEPTYKWRYLGGTPMWTNGGGAGVWSGWATLSGTIGAPRAGDYVVMMSGHGVGGGGGSAALRSATSTPAAGNQTQALNNIIDYGKTTRFGGTPAGAAVVGQGFGNGSDSYSYGYELLLTVTRFI